MNTTLYMGAPRHKDVCQEAAIKLHKEAAEYAGLPYPFDMDEEKYYQQQKVDKYNAYIAGYVSALTTPVTNTGETNQVDVFAQTEAYLQEQL